MATNDTEQDGIPSDDEIEARQRAEDGEDPNANPVAGEAEAEDPNAAATDKAAGAAEIPAKTDPDPQGDPAQVATDKPAADPAGGESVKVEGVRSKDGTRVLPYAALQAERRSARAANARADRAGLELEAAKQLIADMKAGNTPQSDLPTEEDVADLEANFPDEGKKMRALFNRALDLEKQVPKAAPKDEPTDDPAQEAIDQVPLLLEWQHDPAHADTFARAVEHDALLTKSPKWRDKSVVERFAEAARRTADEFDIPYPEPKKSTASSAATQAADPSPADKAQRKPPETLSDFKGGSIADHASIDVQKASPQALLNRMYDMTDEQIDAHLAKYG